MAAGPARASRPGRPARREGTGLDRIGILYAIDALQRGGTETQLAGLLARLDRDRFRPHLLTLGPSRDGLLAAVDCPRRELPVPALLRPAAARAVASVARWIRAERIAATHSFFQDATLVTAVAARLAGVPVRLAGLRDLGFWRDRRSVAVTRLARPLLTGWVANSEAVREHAVAADGLPRERIAVIPNGIDAGAWPFAAEAPAPPAVGLLGNLNREIKRPDLFLRAAALVAPGHPEVLWHLVGDGRLRPGCRDLADGLGLSSRVRFAGRVSDPAPLLRGWSVGVLCSDSEGFPNALLEYMLSGCAVVATAVGGNRELVDDGRTGLLVPPDDADSLAAAIRTLLRDEPLRRRLARAARRRVERDYTWDRCLRSHEDLYLRLLSAAGRR